MYQIRPKPHNKQITADIKHCNMQKISNRSNLALIRHLIQGIVCKENCPTDKVGQTRLNLWPQMFLGLMPQSRVVTIVFGDRSLHPKRMLEESSLYTNYYFFDMKGKNFTRSSLGRTGNKLLLFVIIFSPLKHRLSRTSFRRRGSEAGRSLKAHQHQQWHGGCWHQHPWTGT